MLTTVDRVIARLSLKHPVSGNHTAAARDDAAQFASQLLENYKGQLAQRGLYPGSPPKPTAS